MQYIMRPASPPLRDYVQGYWLVEDLAGLYRGPIRTVPHTHAVLAVHLGEPCLSDFATGAPSVSLMGLQCQVRDWQAVSGCYVVMAMLSLRGLARLFPNVGADASEDLLELGAILGDKAMRHLRADVSAAPGSDHAIRQVDRWLCDRLGQIEERTGNPRFEAALHVLLRSGRVEAAVQTAQVSERQLQRWFDRHIGWNPRSVLGLAKVQSSLHAVQTGRGNPLAGFSDQAHQIRSWKRYLGVTPGKYERDSVEIAALMAEAAAREGTGLSHFI